MIVSVEPKQIRAPKSLKQSLKINNLESIDRYAFKHASKSLVMRNKDVSNRS